MHTLWQVGPDPRGGAARPSAPQSGEQARPPACSQELDNRFGAAAGRADQNLRSHTALVSTIRFHLKGYMGGQVCRHIDYQTSL